MEQRANMRFVEALGGDTVTSTTLEEVTRITADSGSKRTQIHTQSSTKQLQFISDDMCHVTLSNFFNEISVPYHKIDNPQFKEYTKRCWSDTKTKHLGQSC